MTLIFTILTMGRFLK